MSSCRFPVVVTVLFLLANSASPQGNLTPPGAPAPTMKTLDQVEARIIVNAANCPGDGGNSFLISQPGSYYLTSNITGASGKNAIGISAANVTLDLNGYRVAGVAGAGTGVITDQANVTVRNGTVSNWPASGIFLIGPNGRVERILATANGVGIDATNAIVDHCSAGGNAVGISMSKGQLLNSSISSNNGSNALNLHSAMMMNCAIQFNAMTGLSTTDSLVKDCLVEGNGNNGIEALDTNVIVGNRCSNNANAGILTISTLATGSRIEGNFLSFNGTGLNLGASKCVVRGNIVVDNGSNYNISTTAAQLELLISELPVTINAPAKVTLAGSLSGVVGQNGITVTSDNVSVDLAGHALIGVSGSLDGILISGARANISVRNGIVRNWAGDGIDASAANNGGTYTDLDINNNGGTGLKVSSRAVVRSVSSYSNAGDGINGSGANMISKCLASLNTGWGINSTGNDSTIEACLVNQNTAGGIQVGGSDSLIVGNTLDNHTGIDALLVSGARCRIDGNHLTRNGTGIHVSGTSNLIIRNSVSQAGGTPYNIVAGNDAGPIGTAAASTSPWTNFQ